MVWGISYGAAAIAAVASMIVGFLWYGPLFGNLWIKLSGWTPKQVALGKKQNMTGRYITALIGSFVMAVVLDILYASMGVDIAILGLAFGFLIWVGLMLTLTLSSVLWEGKSVKLYMLNNAYNLVNILVMSAIVASW
jgi:hypothetical protein